MSVTCGEPGEHLPTQLEWPSIRTARYTVVVLTLAYTLAYVDRSMLGLLVEPIRADLGISDTQFSLLSGAAFAVFYVAMGLPMGWLADHTNRRNLIVAGMLMWSCMTASGAFAHSFAQLFVTRIFVGVGEATLTPAALSIISDSFPRHRRPLALGLYMSAVALGSGLAYLIGGTMIAWVTRFPAFTLPGIGPISPWRATFFVVGLPGLLLAALVLAVKEPHRHERRPNTALPAGMERTRQSLTQAASFVWKNRRIFLPVFIAFGGLTLHSISLQAWLPTLFVRAFGWDAGRIGLIYGGILLVFATLGMIGGSWFATRLEQRGHSDALLRAPLLMAAVMTPLAVLATLIPDPWITLLLMTPVTALSYGLFAVVPGILHAITPNDMRGQTGAIFSVFDNVIGVALGTSVVAILTDFIFRDSKAIGFSMALVSLIVPPACALLLAWSLKPFRQSIDAAREWSTPQVADAADA